jgi:hypothetical protein
MNTNTKNQTEHQPVPALSLESVLNQLTALVKRLEGVASDLAASAQRQHAFTTQDYIEMRVEAELLGQLCRGEKCMEASGLAEGVRSLLADGGLHLPAKQVERLVACAMLRLFDSKFECSVEVEAGRVISAYVGVALRDEPSGTHAQG